jgi:NADPH:quinone reductase-like Zn-dependent oxidoreductase
MVPSHVDAQDDAGEPEELRVASAELMQAIVIDAFGPPDVLREAALPVPVPAADEALVRVEAVGVNPIDWATRAGVGVPVAAFPVVLGWDLCGRVVAVGEEAGAVAAGDEVFALVGFPGLASAYAECVTVPVSDLAPKPRGTDTVTAAAAPMASLTAWQAIVEQGQVGRGMRTLIHGASGGVGHIAVQLAKRTGAEVVGTASKASAPFVTGLGADVLDYHGDWMSDAGMFDVVLDTRGGDDFVRLLDLISPGGTMVTLKGRDPKHNGIVVGRDLRVEYTYVGPNGALLAQLGRLVGDGSLQIVVDETFKLNQAAAAHRAGEAGGIRGKLVLEVG